MTPDQQLQRAYDEARRMLWAEYSKAKRGDRGDEAVQRAKELAEVFDAGMLVFRAPEVTANG